MLGGGGVTGIAWETGAARAGYAQAAGAAAAVRASWQ